MIIEDTREGRSRARLIPSKVPSLSTMSGVTMAVGISDGARMSIITSPRIGSPSLARQCATSYA